MNHPKRKIEDVEPLNENLSLRRRLDFDALKQEIDSIVDYELHVCRYPNAGEFTGDVCDMLKDRFIEDVVNSTRIKVSPRERDILYHYLVDTFGDYLVKVYISKCRKSLNETKKTYVVTESQYKNLLNPDEKLNRKIKLIKKFINDIIVPKYPVCNIEVYITKGTHRDVLMVKVYLSEKMSYFKTDEILDDVWNSVYNMFGVAVGVESVTDEC